jgi:hypothetical protein
VSHTLVYFNELTRDAFHKCGEASLGYLHEVFLGKKPVGAKLETGFSEVTNKDIIIV